MVIQIDTREKPDAIKGIIEDFEENGVTYISSKLYIGDYMNIDHPKLVIDRKQNISEICANVASSAAEHDRFRAELQRAEKIGAKIIVLIEHGHGYQTLEDIQYWENPRRFKSPRCTNGEKLYRILKTMCERYPMEVMFCDKSETGAKIRELLDDKGRNTGNDNND